MAGRFSKFFQAINTFSSSELSSLRQNAKDLEKAIQEKDFARADQITSQLEGEARRMEQQASEGLDKQFDRLDQILGPDPVVSTTSPTAKPKDMNVGGPLDEVEELLRQEAEEVNLRLRDALPSVPMTPPGQAISSRKEPSSGKIPAQSKASSDLLTDEELERRLEALKGDIPTEEELERRFEALTGKKPISSLSLEDKMKMIAKNKKEIEAREAEVQRLMAQAPSVPNTDPGVASVPKDISLDTDDDLPSIEELEREIELDKLKEQAEIDALEHEIDEIEEEYELETDTIQDLDTESEPTL